MCQAWCIEWLSLAVLCSLDGGGSARPSNNLLVIRVISRKGNSEFDFALVCQSWSAQNTQTNAQTKSLLPKSNEIPSHNSSDRLSAQLILHHTHSLSLIFLPITKDVSLASEYIVVASGGIVNAIESINNKWAAGCMGILPAAVIKDSPIG